MTLPFFDEGFVDWTLPRLIWILGFNSAFLDLDSLESTLPHLLEMFRYYCALLELDALIQFDLDTQIQLLLP